MLGDGDHIAIIVYAFGFCVTAIEAVGDRGIKSDPPAFRVLGHEA